MMSNTIIYSIKYNISNPGKKNAQMKKKRVVVRGHKQHYALCPTPCCYCISFKRVNQSIQRKDENRSSSSRDNQETD